MWHQTKGINLPGIIRDQEIKRTPRFDITGKTQEQLELEFPAAKAKNGLFLHRITVTQDAAQSVLVWENGQRPVTWLTTENKPITSVFQIERMLPFPDAEAVSNGFFRIGIDTSKIEVFPWHVYELLGRVSKKWRQHLSQSAGQDDVSQWHFSLTPIPLSAWTVLERWDGSKWNARSFSDWQSLYVNPT
jgi:hypothetical protein